VTILQTTRIKRFSIIDRCFHFFLILTFLTQTVTGFSRLFLPTSWGKTLNGFLGGYDASILIHKQVGVIMMYGFILHILYLLTRIDWKNLGTSLFGPDSLIPNFQDAKHLWQRILWFFGIGSPPKIGRWAYWEKFDYWAVFWGMPLLAVTGIMLMYPVLASNYVPGWALNIAVLLHRAEAILAVSYIFIVHFYIGHLRPSSFPMNQAMFAGSIPMEELEEEKPGWYEQLKEEGKLETVIAKSPSILCKVIYFIFGYAAVGFGVYLLVNGIIYSRYINLH
jgi:cytochrome b subunit of formate dehydrogenase